MQEWPLLDRGDDMSTPITTGGMSLVPQYILDLLVKLNKAMIAKAEQLNPFPPGRRGRYLWTAWYLAKHTGQAYGEEPHIEDIPEMDTDKQEASDAGLRLVRVWLPDYYINEAMDEL
jgi:hypothetical protein